MEESETLRDAPNSTHRKQRLPESLCIETWPSPQIHIIFESFLCTLSTNAPPFGFRGEFLEKGIDARMHTSHGPIVEAIIETAGREDADLIAVASHGRTGLSRVFYGSVAAGVLHRIDRPLLIIRSV